jgi:alkylated DNA repair protein alkB family protein 7
MGSSAQKLIGSSSVHVIENAISITEESSLLAEIEPIFKRKRYQRNHWDQVIVGYKEIELPIWNINANNETVVKIRDLISKVCAVEKEWLPVHVLELEKDGYITPHVDSVKFSGGLVCGVSLLSPAVMVLRPDDGAVVNDNEICAENYAELFLPRRSLYILSGVARYGYTHSIERGYGSMTLDELNRKFGLNFQRDRRVSLIFRDALV